MIAIIAIIAIGISKIAMIAMIAMARASSRPRARQAARAASCCACASRAASRVGGALTGRARAMVVMRGCRIGFLSFAPRVCWQGSFASPPGHHASQHTRECAKPVFECVEGVVDSGNLKEDSRRRELLTSCERNRWRDIRPQSLSGMGRELLRNAASGR